MLKTLFYNRSKNFILNLLYYSAFQILKNLPNCCTLINSLCPKRKELLCAQREGNRLQGGAAKAPRNRLVLGVLKRRRCRRCTYSVWSGRQIEIIQWETRTYCTYTYCTSYTSPPLKPSAKLTKLRKRIFMGNKKNKKQPNNRLSAPLHSAWKALAGSVEGALSLSGQKIIKNLMCKTLRCVRL